MKKKNPDDDESIIWPPTYAKDMPEPKKGHHDQPKAPGSDHHHEHDDEINEDKRRVWEEKNPRNLPPKKGKK